MTVITRKEEKRRGVVSAIDGAILYSLQMRGAGTYGDLCERFLGEIPPVVIAESLQRLTADGFVRTKERDYGVLYIYQRTRAVEEETPAPEPFNPATCGKKRGAREKTLDKTRAALALFKEGAGVYKISEAAGLSDSATRSALTELHERGEARVTPGIIHGRAGHVWEPVLRNV